MKKEVINTEHNCFYNPHKAKEYVYNHRNIFSKYVRRYIFRSHPPIIKEVYSNWKNNKYYWYWCFLKDKIIIYKFNRKPNQKKIYKMLWDLEKEIKRKGGNYEKGKRS